MPSSTHTHTSQAYSLSAIETSSSRYHLADHLNTALDELSRNLSAMIEEVNSFSSSSGITPPPDPSDPDARAPEKSEDPISQIATILNSHLSSLQWIEKSTDGLKHQIRDLQGRVGEVTGSNELLAASGGGGRFGSGMRSSSVGLGNSSRASSVGYGYGYRS